MCCSSQIVLRGPRWRSIVLRVRRSCVLSKARAVRPIALLRSKHATPLGVAPSPGVWLAAVARRTKQLRSGPLVYLPPLYHSLKLLEEICMLDQMSGGHMLLGVGRGISPIEPRYFGIDRDEAPAMYAEALVVILRGMICKKLSFEGKYCRYTDAAVTRRRGRSSRGVSRAAGCSAEGLITLEARQPR